MRAVHVFGICVSGNGGQQNYVKLRVGECLKSFGALKKIRNDNIENLDLKREFECWLVQTVTHGAKAYFMRRRGETQARCYRN